MMTPLVQRAASVMFVIWFVATLTFFALRVLPGDAIESLLVQSGASVVAIEQRREEMGLNRPLWSQYGSYLAGLLRGDFGRSLLSGEPVTRMILARLPATVTLAAGALLSASLLGLALGVLGAVQVRWVSPFTQTLAHVALSTPLYWTGTLAIFVFTAQMRLLPSGGAGRMSQLILPVMVLGFHTSGTIARVVQPNVREMLDADFVRTARAKGLTERAIIVRHVLRASLLPAVTVIALQAGFLMGGTVITESLFIRPGIGRLLLDATLQQDYPVTQGVAIFAAVTYTLFNTVADALYHVIDPRVTL